MSASNLDETKKVIRSLLISAKNGLSSQQLEHDFVSQIGTPIPYESYGHPTLESLLVSIREITNLQSVRTRQQHLSYLSADMLGD